MRASIFVVVVVVCVYVCAQCTYYSANRIILSIDVCMYTKCVHVFLYPLPIQRYKYSFPSYLK